jgi:hypothetical protein
MWFEKVVNVMTERVQTAALDSFWGRVNAVQRLEIKTQAIAGAAMTILTPPCPNA